MRFGTLFSVCALLVLALASTGFAEENVAEVDFAPEFDSAAHEVDLNSDEFDVLTSAEGEDEEESQEGEGDSDEDGQGSLTTIDTERRPAHCQNSCRNPQICIKDGRTYKYRYSRAVYRRGRWYRNAFSNVYYHKCQWKLSKPPAHPNDPRYYMRAGRWLKRNMRTSSMRRIVKWGGRWWRSKRKVYFYFNGKWVKPAYMRVANNPWYYKRKGFWVKTTKKHPYVIWHGFWRRNRRSKQVFWNRRWIHIREAMRNDPHFGYNKAKRRYYRKYLRPRWNLRNGMWFKKKGSQKVFYNRKWTSFNKLYKNDPRYVRRRGKDGLEWTRLHMKEPFVYRRGYWFNTRHGSKVFVNRKWVDARVFFRRHSQKKQRKKHWKGKLSTDMQGAVQNQVSQNFATFMKWFISNYLRAGNNVNAQFKVKDHAMSAKDRLDPEPFARPRGLEQPGIKRGPPPAQGWLVDGSLARKGPMKHDEIKSTLHWAENNALTKAGGVFGARADSINDLKRIRGDKHDSTKYVSFLATNGDAQMSGEASDAESPVAAGDGAETALSVDTVGTDDMNADEAANIGEHEGVPTESAPGAEPTVQDAGSETPAGETAPALF